jgi:hypothetical protein
MVFPFFGVRQLVWPAIRRRGQGMASAHTLLPCCCSQTTVRQCPSRRLYIQVNNFRFARNPPGIRKLRLIWATEAFGD